MMGKDRGRDIDRAVVELATRPHIKKIRVIEHHVVVREEVELHIVAV
jgi:hypothetical protein